MKTKVIVASMATIAVSVPLVMQQRTLASLEERRAVPEVRLPEVALVEKERFEAQEQLAAEWAQYQRDLAELNALRDEAKRLRAAAAANPELHQQLLEARAKFEFAKTAAQLANDTIQAGEVRQKTIAAMKNLGLAARIFASDHNDRFPRNFDEFKEVIGELGIPLDVFEFVPHEREIAETEPQLLLFREKEPRKLPSGKWERSYTMADGSVQTIERDTPDFSEWEKPFIGRKEEQEAVQ